MVLPIHQFFLWLALRGSCQIGLNRVCTQVDRNFILRRASSDPPPFCSPLEGTRSGSTEKQPTASFSGFSVFPLLLGGSLVNPRTRTSNETTDDPSSLLVLSSGVGSDWSSTARVQRGPSEAARCASTEDHQTPSPPPSNGEYPPAS